MKKKNILSLLLISLFTLVTACDNTTSNSTNNAASNSTNSSTNNTTSNSVSSTSSSNNSTSNNDDNGYFNTEDAALLNTYFDFEIPYIDLEYSIDDYTEYYGDVVITILFYDATEDDFDNYMTILNNSFTFDDVYDDGTDYWYYYSYSNFLIDVCYDNYSEDIPYIYLQIMDESLADDSNDEVVETPVVNGYFNEEDSTILATYFNFTVPCAGETYEIYDYSSFYGYTDLLFYLNYVEQTEFDELLETMKSNFTDDGTEDYEGLTYYLFSCEDICIDIAYDATGYDYPYVVMEIYESSDSSL